MSKEVLQDALELLAVATFITPKLQAKRTDVIKAGLQALAEQPAQQEPEFFTHCVDQPYDWSEWVCPDPKGYLMKCCDCGLVHEAEFGVVRYKSETEREECDMVNDPNLQAVFRMRRSEQWSPADMAHRAGGLTMEQPAQQEPVAWQYRDANDDGTWSAWLGCDKRLVEDEYRQVRALFTPPQPAPVQQEPVALLNAISAEPTEMIHKWRVMDIIKSSPPQGIYYTPPPQRTWVGLTNDEVNNLAAGCHLGNSVQDAIYKAVAKLKEKNT